MWKMFCSYQHLVFHKTILESPSDKTCWKKTQNSLSVWRTHLENLLFSHIKKEYTPPTHRPPNRPTWLNSPSATDHLDVSGSAFQRWILSKLQYLYKWMYGSAVSIQWSAQGLISARPLPAGDVVWWCPGKPPGSPWRQWHWAEWWELCIGHVNVMKFGRKHRFWKPPLLNCSSSVAKGMHSPGAKLASCVFRTSTNLHRSSISTTRTSEKKKTATITTTNNNNSNNNGNMSKANDNNSWERVNYWCWDEKWWEC